jgi:hypothetical protein
MVVDPSRHVAAARNVRCTSASVVKETPVVPFHGCTTGFIVNYTPDSAVRFDLDGAPVEMFDRAYAPGHVEILIGGRKLSAGSFAKLLANSE